jgi:hypothetical protein
MDTIRNLLPNEHILNFHAGADAVRLPDWLGDNLKLIVGAGDMEHAGVLNVDKLNMFDVFLCLPEDDSGSLRRNIEAFLKQYPRQKVICFVDTRNELHLKSFCNLFANRFTLVDGHGGHTPHLPIDCISKILKVGGTAVNLYEIGDTVIDEEQLTSIITKEDRTLTDLDLRILFSHIGMLQYNSPNIKAEVIRNYRLYLQQKIFQKLKTNRSIELTWSDLPKENTSETLRPYITAFALVHMFDPLPANLKGVFKANTRIWQPETELIELVVTKVSAGGGQKIKFRKPNRKTAKLKRKSS